MKVRRTKNQIIAAIQNALKSNKLWSGSWMDANPIKKEICSVCAVGSVFMDCVEPNRMESEDFRQLGNFVAEQFVSRETKQKNADLINKLFSDNFDGVVATNYVIGGYQLSGHPEKIEVVRRALIKEKRWLDLLSNVFETEYASTSPYSVKEAAEKTIEYVKANFPRSITIDVNGFPVKDKVQIVKPRKKANQQT